jgi:hypothetical protein
MKHVTTLLVLCATLTACTPQPAHPKPAPPVPTAALAASLRLDVHLSDAPDGGLVAVGKVVNTGKEPLQVARELRLSFQFEPNELSARAPKFGGNAFTVGAPPQFVPLPPASAAPRTSAVPAVEEQLALAKAAERQALQDGRLRVMAQVSVLPAGADVRSAEAREVPLVAVMEIGKAIGGVASSADAGR